mmetsp:Transcript_47593/g.116682  ORF Transcript_47593/g.116682 Transcript_47593/m.116682 type:complete len:234 (+) Transcript_47593:184-885(+)
MTTTPPRRRKPGAHDNTPPRPPEWPCPTQRGHRGTAGHNTVTGGRAGAGRGVPARPEISTSPHKNGRRRPLRCCAKRGINRKPTRRPASPRPRYLDLIRHRLPSLPLLIPLGLLVVKGLQPTEEAHLREPLRVHEGGEQSPDQRGEEEHPEIFSGFVGGREQCRAEGPRRVDPTPSDGHVNQVRNPHSKPNSQRPQVRVLPGRINSCENRKHQPARQQHLRHKRVQHLRVVRP